MGRYRVNVECSQKLPQTKSEYFTHCSYEVQAISKGVAKAMAERLPEWMQEAAVNMLCDKLADARALAASWMNDHGEP